jgi:hypothetical protein
MTVTVTVMTVTSERLTSRTGVTGIITTGIMGIITAAPACGTAGSVLASPLQHPRGYRRVL